MPNTTRKRMQRHGYYASLRDVRCECGNAATRQVEAKQYNASGSLITNVMPLCDDCYNLMLEEERAYCQRVGRQTVPLGVT